MAARLSSARSDSRIDDIRHVVSVSLSTLDRYEISAEGRLQPLHGSLSAITDMMSTTYLRRSPVVSASTLVRAARKSRSLTQGQLAELAQSDQATISRSESGRDAEFSTVDRLLAGAGHRLYSAPTRRDDAATVGAEIRQRLRDGDKDRALRALIQLNDNLLAERGLVRGVLGLAEPETTRDAVWDAALAAVVAWRLRDEELPLPEWVNAPNRFLRGRRGLAIDAADPLPPDAEIPEEFAKRGVLVWRDTFASV